MGKRIIVRKDSKSTGEYTFIDNDTMTLSSISRNRLEEPTSAKSDSNTDRKANDKEYHFKLRNDRADMIKINPLDENIENKLYHFKLRNDRADMKARRRSRLVGGHNTQGHSPVYE